MATVVAIHPETAEAKSLRLRLPEPSRHLAGQHYIVRLTAPDGYTALRSYAVVSPPDGSREIEITVERHPANEVSIFLHDEVRPGDELEMRGPMGGWFVWPGDTPALLLGGGRAGVVPLMAMLRLARRGGDTELVRLILCVGSPEGMYYGDELPGPETTIMYMYRAPATDTRPPGPLTERDIPAVPKGAVTYICGSSSFADTAADLVMRVGTPVEQIRIDRLSPSGSH
jgi:ferredoxin-NADP reductase